MASDKIRNLDANTFNETINETGKPVLVDFWAPWCGPCKAIAPILEELAEELGDKALICKVDVDNNNEISAKFSIRAIPTILIFKDGKVAETIVGMTNKADLSSKLEAHS